MTVFRKSLLASSLLALAPWASAQFASNCPSSNVCYKLNIPQNTASSGSGDIFFQITAPSNYEWVALGQGKGMSNANMFLVYTNQDGSNVTLSPRTTSGHNPPSFNSNAKVELLDGSGISDGIMTANVKCSNCNSWSGGSMDFTGSSGGWLYAYQSSGGPKNTNDQNADIEMHSSKATFTWNFANAKGGDSLNPFTSSSSNSSTPSDPSNPSNPNNSNPNANGDTSDSEGGDDDNRKMMIIAHGVLASLAFVILFPSGAIAIRLASLPGIVWIHAAFQLFAVLVYIAAFGLGVYITKDLDLLSEHHPIIGIVVFVLVLVQPMLGFVHHLFFKKYQRRTVWSHAHIWVGRIAITLGIINGGMGLDLANDMKMSSTGGIVAYSIVAALMWLAWVAAMIVGERRKKRQQADASSKYNNLPGSSYANREGTEMPTLQNAHKGDR